MELNEVPAMGSPIVMACHGKIYRYFTGCESSFLKLVQVRSILYPDSYNYLTTGTSSSFRHQKFSTKDHLKCFIDVLMRLYCLAFHDGMLISLW